MQDENAVIYVLSGRMTVTPDGGEPAEVKAGDIAVFPVRWNGTWDIHETARKVYSIKILLLAISTVPSANRRMQSEPSSEAHTGQTHRPGWGIT